MGQRPYLPAARTLACAALACAAALLAGCAASGPRPQAPTQGDELATLQRADAVWLARVDFGLDSRAVRDFRRLGRERYLDEQLHAGAGDLPAPIALQLHALQSAQIDPALRLQTLQLRRKALDAMADADKDAARKSLNDEGNQVASQAVRLQLLRAVYSPDQLREQMVWFWLNHFSVFQYKGDLRWLIADYEEQAIRPHALGHFRDLVMATLEHPAMLQYLDNSQNAAGHLNENYARELMELHTLGVNGGYSQQDVQQLARVLTGVGINANPAPHLKPEWQALYVRRGAFEFNPARHDFGPKTLLGRTVAGQGIRRGRARGRADRRAAGVRALHLPRARHLLRRRHAPATSGRGRGADLRQERRRHRRDAAHAPAVR